MNVQHTMRRSAQQHDDWDQVHQDWLTAQQAGKTNDTAQPTIAPKDDPSEKDARETAQKVAGGQQVNLSGMSGSSGTNRIFRETAGGPGNSTNNKFDTFRITGADLEDADIKKRIDALGESGLVEYIDKTNDGDVRLRMMSVLESKYPDLPAMADLVSVQLQAKLNERHTPFIFSTLQKLNKDQGRIDLLKPVYRHRAGTELDKHLRDSLTGQDLDLALDLINIQSSPDKPGLVAKLPATEDDYKALAHKLHAAMLPFPGIAQAIFGVLIPFNHDAEKLQKLSDTYTQLYPGRKLGDDIRGHLKGENASYALYLLNAPPAETGTHTEVPVRDPGKEKRDTITGGTVSVHTDASFRAGLQNTNTGFSVGYQGGLAAESRWLQFIWKEMEVTTEIAGKDHMSRWGGETHSVGGTHFYQLDPAHPHPKVDAPADGDSPFYEHFSVDNRTSDGTTIYDAPRASESDVAERFDKGAKKVVVRAHMDTFLIRDYLAVYQTGIVIEWEFNERPGQLPPRKNSVTKMTAVNGLPKPFKQALDGDKNYGKKYRYIR